MALTGQTALGWKSAGRLTPALLNAAPSREWKKLSKASWDSQTSTTRVPPPSIGRSTCRTCPGGGVPFTPSSSRTVAACSDDMSGNSIRNPIAMVGSFPLDHIALPTSLLYAGSATRHSPKGAHFLLSFRGAGGQVRGQQDQRWGTKGPVAK